MHGAAHQANPWAEPAPGSPGAWGVPGQFPGSPPPGGREFPGLPPAGSGLVDRAPKAVLVVAALLVIALIAGVGYVAVKGGRQYPSAWDPRVEGITKWVAKERELDFEHPVKVNFLTDKEYTARSTEGGDQGSTESKQYYDDQAAQLRALGFLEGKVDLAKANDTLSDSGTLAYYDPEVKEVFVRGTALTPAVRVTLAHELTHVLQDQHFDLNRIGKLDSGRASVLRALGEGDATKVEDAYVAKGLSAKDRATYMKESAASAKESTDAVDASVPPILSTVFASPYILGPELISYLDQKGGWTAINEALEDPPTEEAMFDPSTYGTDAARQQTVDIKAPTGTEVLDKSEFGPTTWYLLLASRLDPAKALAATDGWGGDQYVVYRQDGKVCLDATIEGDTPDDTKELATALGEWAAKSPKGTTAVTSDTGEVQFHSCDPGTKAKAVGTKVTPDLLTLPVTRTELYVQAMKADKTPKESACFANGVVDKFTLSQLSDPDGAFLNSTAGQQIISELRLTCFN